MKAEDLKVGNILVELASIWGPYYHRFYRVKKETPEMVILDHLVVKDAYMPKEITDEVYVSLRVQKRIACNKYELYDPNDRYYRYYLKK